MLGPLGILQEGTSGLGYLSLNQQMSVLPSFLLAPRGPVALGCFVLHPCELTGANN